MYPAGYYTMIRSHDYVFDCRLRIVMHALSQGVKSATQLFQTSPRTVRKWRNRYQTEGSRGLVDRSRAPHTCPHKLPPEAEQHIIRLRNRLFTFGAQHLKDEFDLPWGVNSIARVIRQNCRTRLRKRKHQRKNDLRHIKAAYKPFTRFQMDTKYLNDIPHYWLFMTLLGLPRFQYTIRELSVGAEFLAYADEISVTYATITIKRFLEHLEKHGIDLKEVTIQSDNGSEFDGGRLEKSTPGFVHAIEKEYNAHHAFIPPGCRNANADVESVHATIESEFYDLESFNSRPDFLEKSATYQYYYNLARKNRSRGRKSPLELLAEKAPEISCHILDLPPVDLEAAFKPRGGYHVPSAPEISKI